MDIFNVFIEKVKNSPNEIMICEDEFELSYYDAYKMVNYYAKEISDITGGKQTRILLSLNHSHKIIIAILSILKTGNSYVPVSKKSDYTRFKAIANYCDTDVIISDTNKFDDMREIVISDYKVEVEGDYNHYIYNDNDEVYVLFTSGSTGEPKGCSVTYHNLCYIIRNMTSISQCDENSKYCFSTPYTFDVSTTEIYSFVYGAKIYICDTSDYEKFNNFPFIVSNNNISHLALSPSSLKNMYNAYTKKQLDMMGKTLKCVMVAGEAFKKEIFEKWKRERWGYRLWNLYGPTEATVYATGYELSSEESYNFSIPIGRCLEGATYFIDQKDQDGIGELVLGGEGIANGYINNETEQKNRFLYEKGKRYYRTGDLVSIKDDLLIYHGRNDDQVQINGIRVELGEVESRILEIPEVHETVVIYHEGILVATLVLKDQVDVSVVKKQLENKIPRYMMPNIFRCVDSFEVTSSNKIDRKKILQNYLLEKGSENHLTISSGLSNDILQMMEECLGEKGSINSLTDDFYECGANSLDTFLLLTKIEQKYKIKVPVDIIYTLRTSDKLAEYISADESYVSDNKGVKKSEYAQLVQLSSQVKNYLYKENNEIKDIYRALYLQGYYYNYKLDSAVSFKYDIGNRFNPEQIRQAILNLIRQNSILNSKMHEENGTLYFKEYYVDDSFSIPEISFEYQDNDVLDFITDNYSNEMFYARYKEGYLALFILVKQADSYTVIGILDHTIADTASISLIKIKLGEMLSSNEYKTSLSTSLSYKNYCQLINSKNRNINDALNHWYIEKLKKCKVNNKGILFNNTNNQSDYFSVDVSKNNFANNLEIIKYLGFIIGEKISGILDQECFALRSIVNLREYKNYSFKNTLGDLHGSISMFWERGNDLNEFVKRADQVISLFSEDFFRHSVYLMNNSQEDSAQKEALKHIVDGADIISINYGGTIDENELNSYIENISEIQEKMFNINKRIYVTAFMKDSKLHIFVNRKL